MTLHLPWFAIQIELEESPECVWPRRLGAYSWGTYWFASLLWLGVHVYVWRRP